MPDGMRYSSVYQTYIGEAYQSSHSEEIAEIRADLLSDLTESPDFQRDAKRNGVPQPMVFTRGGEDHGYNVICLPGDELFAGDIIDAFGEKWLVMRARADTTTHKMGVMYQCNKLLRFQNADGQIYERWSYVDVSGYSSSFNSSTKMQSSAEQMVIYLPLDEATEKIYVDKRLALNTAYDRFGRKMLSVLKVTGANPIAESFNGGDHILMLKLERDLYDEEADNLELEICDYLSSRQHHEDSHPMHLSCAIDGRQTLRIGRTGRYKSIFLNDADEVSVPIPVWSMVAEEGIQMQEDGRDVLITIPDEEALIGGMIQLSLCADDSRYGTATMTVEVSSLV